MMIFRGTVLVLVGMMLVGAMCHRSDEFAGGTASLRGVVIDSATGEPLIGVSVSLKGTTMGALTDLDGRYNIRGISPRAWTVRFTSVGYRTAETTLVLEAKRQIECDIALEIQQFDIPASTILHTYCGPGTNDTATLKGVIRDSLTYRPIPGAEVQVKNHKLKAISDSVGNYCIKGLWLGECSLEITCGGYRKRTIEFVITSEGSTKTQDIALEHK